MDTAEVVDEKDAVELLLFGLMYGENMEWIDNADCAPVEVEVSSAAPPPLLLRGRLRL
jgi:hypothetical protein